MTIWSIPLTGIKGRRPLRDAWRPAFKHDTRIILDGECPEVIPLPHFDGMSLCHYEYQGDDLGLKFRGEYDFIHLTPHLPTTYCEIVIDDSFWKPPFMPDYPSHDDVLKLQTVMMAGSTLITALRLIGFNQFIAPCFLKNGTLASASDSDDRTIEFYPQHPFLLPMPLLEKSKARLSLADFEWVCEAHLTLYQTCFNHDLSPAMSAMSYYYHDMPARAKMTLIWAAIEDLLKPSQSSIRFGIRARGAMMIGRSDEEKKMLFKQIGDLYGKRSAATHGRKFTYNQGLRINTGDKKLLPDLLALRSSYQLLCEILIRIVDRNSMFSDSELSQLEREYKEKFLKDE